MGVPVYSLNMPRGRATAHGLVKLWRLLRMMRPRILQTWLYHGDLLGLIFGKLASIRNICWNIRCSYMDWERYRFSTKWAVKMCSYLSSFPQAIITNSLEARKFHVGLGYKAKRWKVIPNGFDLERFKPDREAKPRLLNELGISAQFKGEENNTILIGFIARHDPMKDHPTFFKAASELIQERGNVHFILSGNGIKPENRSIAMQIPDIWKNHFHLLGEREDIEKITAALDIASLVSHGEGFPNVICEAMACEVPCVTTDVGDAAFIVNNTGYVVPPSDSKALAGAWKALIDLGSDGRRELGLSARNRVITHFELPKVVKDYEDFYRSLCSQPRLL